MQLAATYMDNVHQWPVAVEKKYDGIRCLLHYHARTRKVTAYSRGGHVISSSIEEICAQLKRRCKVMDKDLWLDGEIVHRKSNPSKSWGPTISCIQSHDRSLKSQLCFYAFDYLDNPDDDRTPYVVRRDKLDKFFPSKTCTKKLDKVTQQIAFSKTDLLSIYNDTISKGYEGVMIKDLHAPYKLKRCKSWMKMKPRDENHKWSPQ